MILQIDDSKDTIIIKIHRLKLIQGCSLLHHPDIHRLFVEFSFLGKSGFEYETESVPIPKSHTQNMYFKYQIKICINEKRNLNERNYLDGILCGEKNPNVQFNIVSEPLAEEMETKECIDVGHAYLNLKKHVLGKGDSNIFLTVKNPENTDIVGVLKISIIGLNNIRQLLSKSTSVEES
ncbi:hypothetical protein PV325_011938 [Microctonus aethiopoides]|nr:hypothetical protein PV325_011938 [Microctonus aethiopoides]